jgi:hypothetical protein
MPLLKQSQNGNPLKQLNRGTIDTHQTQIYDASSPGLVQTPQYNMTGLS